MNKKRGRNTNDIPKDHIYKPYSLKARSDNQLQFIKDIQQNHVICGHGPAGTGKTHIAIGMAVKMLRNADNPIEQIVLTRPAVEGGGEKLGFLPGKYYEKIEPYLEPLYDELNYFVSLSGKAQFINQKTLVVKPLAYIRGKTFKNAVIIVDESQNASYNQLKMIWTRLGENSKIIFIGDSDQSDLPRHMQGGFEELMEVMDGLRGFCVSELDTVDNCRHPMVQAMLEHETRENSTKIEEIYVAPTRNKNVSS